MIPRFAAERLRVLAARDQFDSVVIRRTGPPFGVARQRAGAGDYWTVEAMEVRERYPDGSALLRPVTIAWSDSEVGGFRLFREALRIAGARWQTTRVDSARKGGAGKGPLSDREIVRVRDVHGLPSDAWVEGLDERLFRLGWLDTNGHSVRTYPDALDDLFDARGRARGEVVA